MRLKDHDDHVETKDHANGSAGHSHIEHINIHISEVDYCFKSLYEETMIETSDWFWSRQ